MRAEEQVKNLLGDRFDPYELPDIFSYLNEEQQTEWAEKLGQDLANSQDDEQKDRVRTEWLENVKIAAEETMNHKED